MLLRRALGDPRSAEPALAAALVTAQEVIRALAARSQQLQTALDSRVDADMVLRVASVRRGGAAEGR